MCAGHVDRATGVLFATFARSELLRLLNALAHAVYVIIISATGFDSVQRQTSKLRMCHRFLDNVTIDSSHWPFGGYLLLEGLLACWLPVGPQTRAARSRDPIRASAPINRHQQQHIHPQHPALMPSFHQSLHRFLRVGVAPTAALLATSASAARLEAASPEPVATTPPTKPVEFVGVFLAKDSAAQLLQRYPAKFATADDGTLFLVLKFNPSEQEKEAFAPILGSDAQLQIKGYAEDDTTQAVLVSVTTRDGEPLEYDSGAEHAHITLSAAAGTGGLNAGYSNVLLERLRASDKLRFLLDAPSADADAPREWNGELPAFVSSHFPLYSPFPAARATLVRSDEAAAADNPSDAALQLQGTVCVSSAFDAATGACASGSGKPECGFCKFMKAGPCGREFSAWEACLDQSKKDGADFIERCGAPTLALRDCVDANPEYYSVLSDPPADDDDA